MERAREDPSRKVNKPEIDTEIEKREGDQELETETDERNSEIEREMFEIIERENIKEKRRERKKRAETKRNEWLNKHSCFRPITDVK